jgi:hypothetical protein
VQQRLDANPEAMRQRRETVEHPFGTMKARMGATHFLTKTDFSNEERDPFALKDKPHKDSWERFRGPIEKWNSPAHCTSR